MDVLIFAGILIGLAAFVAAPLYAKASRPATTTGRSALAARSDTVLAGLRDLEIDHASGLLDEASYEAERSALETEATGLLSKLEGPND
jgi:hypothetical protein